MRKYLLCLLFLSVPGLGFGQLDLVHESGPAIALKGGMLSGFTPSTLRESYNTGYSVGAWASTPISSRVVVRPSIEFGQLAFDVRKFLEENQGQQSIVSVAGGNYHSLAVGVDALIGFSRSSMIAAYGILGGGYYRGTVQEFRVRAVDDVSIVEAESSSGIGLTGGAGIRADMNEQLGAFAEMKLVYGVMNQNHLVFPIGVGIFLKL